MQQKIANKDTIVYFTCAACAAALALDFIDTDTIFTALVGMTVRAAIVNTAAAVCSLELFCRWCKLTL